MPSYRQDMAVFFYALRDTYTDFILSRQAINAKKTTLVFLLLHRWQVFRMDRTT
jgi:hypothetical protein